MTSHWPSFFSLNGFARTNAFGKLMKKRAFVTSALLQQSLFLVSDLFTHPATNVHHFKERGKDRQETKGLRINAEIGPAAYKAKVGDSRGLEEAKARSPACKAFTASRPYPSVQIITICSIFQSTIKTSHRNHVRREAVSKDGTISYWLQTLILTCFTSGEHIPKTALDLRRFSVLAAMLLCAADNCLPDKSQYEQVSGWFTG
ncbi:Hypothetical predicted protein [Podarcis lilfordi]|uniref:Uncharacterized protein n=1 Tax=Podarcis lilfordi TaxID=74358 RepID=A0AA35P1D4_9SAUR|nr:Hypothetical predicted protein [Podarcis lilfordi]